MSVPRLLFGFLAAPLAWAGQLVVGYGAEEVGCPSGSAVAAVTVGATLLFGAVALAGSAVALRAWRRPGDDPNGRVAFMGFGGLLWSVLFLVIILLGGVQLLALDTCAG